VELCKKQHLRDFWGRSIFDFFNNIPSGTDIANVVPHVRFVPILLRKSFWGGERKLLEPLMRLTRGDARDHIVSPKIDHGPP
jgi:hypothetical protein